jgi:hypothetical protein
MDLRKAARYAGKPEFWRGFGTGLRTSLNSPRNRERFGSSFRVAFYASLIGSLAAIRWVQHSHTISGRPPSAFQELGVAMVGAFGATGLVNLCRWLWARATNR